ncbi:kynurenine formamidase-like isoform X2 [Biomphalaria pfeifferi]|uniref:Kynurenine formamidase-like isoform X2 n=1 Tax=Biomphalaria pfeifferi TaxID=112525 RepID=A0AAD8BKP7_BIOPF|nr:kynurenine formamidase-like isoform X2 [Biomphalaria pfeifferi]
MLQGASLLLMSAALWGLSEGCWGSPGCRVVDMSHSLDTHSQKFPIMPDFHLTLLARGIQDGGYWIEYYKFDTPEHISTHMDAPSHFAQEGWKLHEIPIERFMGPGVVIDIRAKAARNPDYRLGIADLKSWEKRYGKIPDGAIVFLWSGWDVRYPNTTLFFNTNSSDASFHFPGFHPAAMSWLVNKRNISMIGVDTPSVDYGPSTTFETHQVMSKANIMGLEMVNNLGLIPASGAHITALPIKLLNGSGGLTRVVATFIQEKNCAFYK